VREDLKVDFGQTVQIEESGSHVEYPMETSDRIVQRYVEMIV